MADYICIDGGTTNTRVRLVRSRQITDVIQLGIGVTAANDDMAAFKNQLKDAIDNILARNALAASSITRILTSGMITSDLGLYPLAHGLLPAGIQELHRDAQEVLFPEISSIPFVFIRGLRTNEKTVEAADVMRGEETELMGISSCAACTYVLPGSHTKIIETDEEGRIVDFFTTLTGEMVYSLASHTILRKSISLENAELDENALTTGYRCFQKEGLNKALFKVRVADTICGKNQAELYSFFLGAILAGDVDAILKKARRKIVISGRKQLKDALYLLLKANCNLEIVCLTPSETDASVALGAIKIYEYEG